MTGSRPRARGGFVARVDDGAGHPVVRVEGELDIATSPEFHAAMSVARAGSADVVLLDVGELSFLGVAGLRAIVEEAAELAAEGRALLVERPSDTVKRLVALLGADEVLHVTGGGGR